MTPYMPEKDADLRAWATNFLAVATANLATLGLTASDLNGVSGDASDFGGALDAIQTVKAQYEAAVKAKNGDRKDFESLMRPLVKRIQATAGVPDSLKTQLGITANSGIINRTPPTQPALLVATPQADGTNVLKWRKMGNKATTQFVVLAKPLTSGMSASNDAGWTMVGQTTKTRFDHNGVTPGVPMAYKVLAARAGQASPPSLPATVYAV